VEGANCSLVLQEQDAVFGLNPSKLAFCFLIPGLQVFARLVPFHACGTALVVHLTFDEDGHSREGDNDSDCNQKLNCRIFFLVRHLKVRKDSGTCGLAKL